MKQEIKDRISQIQNGIVPEGYKKTVVGIVPEEWEETTLSELFTFKNGLNKEKEAFGKGTPIINYTDVWKKRGIRAATVEGKVELSEKEIENYNVQKGDVFFTRTSETRDEIGLSSVLLDDIDNAVFSGFVLRARPINDRVETRYHQYCYSSPLMRHEIIRKSSITTRALTSGVSLGQVAINLPSKPEQKRIADILEKWDERVEFCENEVELLRNLKNVYLFKMFPSKNKEIPDIRFMRYYDSWGQVKIGEIARTTIGEFVIKTKQNDNSPYPVYNGGVTYTGFYDDFNNEGNKIIISARGANAGFVNIVKSRYWAGNSCYSVDIFDKNNYNIDFVYQEMKRNQSRFTFHQQAANIPSVSKTDVERFVIDVPSINEQNQISKFFLTLDRLIELKLCELDIIRKQQKSMQQLLLTGIVRV